MCLLVIDCYRCLCCPCVSTGLPLLQPNHLHVFRDILSPKTVYGVFGCLFRPKMVSPGDHVWYHSSILSAHVLTRFDTIPLDGVQEPQCHWYYINNIGTASMQGPFTCVLFAGIIQFALTYPCTPSRDTIARSAGGIPEGVGGGGRRTELAPEKPPRVPRGEQGTPAHLGLSPQKI